MVAGNRTEDGSGAIRLFESADGTHWRYAATLDASCNEYGRMWECPDFFPLDGKQVLMVSPQEMTAIGLEFHAGYGVVALLGSYDKASYRFEREAVQAVDYGTDFYAPQTLETPDGRRIMIAWDAELGHHRLQAPGLPLVRADDPAPRAVHPGRPSCPEPGAGAGPLSRP